MSTTPADSVSPAGLVAFTQINSSEGNKFFAVSPNLLCIVGLDGRIQKANPAWERLLGYSIDEVNQKRVTDFVHPQDQAHVRAEIARLLAGGTLDDFEVCLLHKDGTPRCFLWSSTHDREDGSFYGVGHDITRRKQAEAELRRSEERARAMNKAIPDLMFRIRADGLFLDVMAKDADKLVMPVDKIVGSNLANSPLPEEVIKRGLQALEQVLREGGPQRFEYEVATPGGHAHFEARFFKCGEDEVLTLIRDISDRVHVDQMKNEFISVVSHELRTPLAAIRGSLGLILGGAAGAMSEQAQSLLSIANRNVDRLIRIINDILDLERIEMGKMAFDIQAMELAPAVTQSIQLICAYAKQFNVRIEVTKRLDNIFVAADRDRICQVVDNLLANAIHVSQSGGVVEVMMLLANKRVRLAVTDRGPGIPDKVRARLFTRFFHISGAKSRPGGSGLGLSICKEIVDRHEGTIGCYSEVDMGSTFFFDLPCYETLEAAKTASLAAVKG